MQVRFEQVLSGKGGPVVCVRLLAVLRHYNSTLTKLGLDPAAAIITLINQLVDMAGKV